MKHRLVARLMAGCSLFTLVAAHATTLDTELKNRSWMATQERWPCNYHGELTQQRTLSGGSLTITSTGRFWHDCKRGLIWSTSTPVVDARVYTNAGNDVLLSRRGDARALDSLADRYMGSLLRSVFAGRHDALAADFSVGEVTSDGVELLPRDPRVAAQIRSLTLGGDAEQAWVTMEPVDTAGDHVHIVLDSFSADDGSRAACEAWITTPENACDALRSPLRYLERDSN